MFVDGVAVVEVADDVGFNVSPGGQEKFENAGVVHGAKGGGRVGEGEEGAQLGPVEGGGGEESGEFGKGVVEAALGFGVEGEAVTGNELKEAEDGGGIGFGVVGRFEKDEVARDSEFGGGETGAPVTEASQEGVAFGFVGVHGADCLAVDGFGAGEVGAHEGGRVVVWGKAGGGDFLLRVEGEEVGVAGGGEVEEEAERGEEFAGGGKGGEISVVSCVETGEPVKEMEIAPAAGTFLDVRFEVVDGVLESGVALMGEAAEAAGESAALVVKEAGQLFGELVVEGLVAGEETLVEEADGEFYVSLVELTALGDGADGLAEAESGVPEGAQEVGECVFGRGRKVGAGGEDEKVDVGEGKEFTAPEAAEGDEGESVREGALEMGMVGGKDGGFDGLAAVFEEGGRAGAVEKQVAKMVGEVAMVTLEVGVR